MPTVAEIMKAYAVTSESAEEIQRHLRDAARAASMPGARAKAARDQAERDAARAARRDEDRMAIDAFRARTGFPSAQEFMLEGGLRAALIGHLRGNGPLPPKIAAMLASKTPA